MARDSMDILELLHKRGMYGDLDFLREALAVLVNGIMGAEASVKAGAGYGERSPDRVTHRNGCRTRSWDTRVGTMELRIPKLRDGSYFPSLLEPRCRSEKALLAVIQQAYVEGVSTRRVDDPVSSTGQVLVKALGCEGISKPVLSMPKGARYHASAGVWMKWRRSSLADPLMQDRMRICGWTR